MASVTIRNLVKRYGDTVAIKGLSLEIRDGEFIVLVGPSGCGKTTLLNSIAGLLRVEEGEIWIGENLAVAPEQGVFIPPQKRGVAMVFQDYAIYPHMTVFGNIAFPLEIRKVEKKEIRKRVVEIAQLLEIEDLLGRKPRALSGGQKQRVALARAIIRSPKVFLMDEPFANLDAKLRVRARVEIKRLQRELGITTVFVTHDQTEAMTMGDRIAVMNTGCIEQVGSPTTLYEEPRNLFVAGFIGSPPMNMWPAQVKLVQGKRMADLGFFAIELPAPVFEAAKAIGAKELMVGVRPEHIVIHPQPQERAFEAQVVHIEPIGKEFNVYLEANGESLVATVNSVSGLEIGQRVWLAFGKGKVHFFDRSSGKALR